jgi:UDP-N-acetylglucosamine 4,6-dehydratase/5-epimerase
MTTLITGGTGSFGHAYVEAHPDEPLRVLSRDEEKQRAMRSRFPDVEYVIGDVRDHEAVREAMWGVESVIHAAALKHVGTGEAQPSETIRTNVAGTENVCRSARDFGVRVVLLSTDKAVEPINAYGASKMLAERLALAYGHSVVRYGNVLGSRGSIVPLFREQVAQGRPLTITDPDMTRFVMTLDQAIALVRRALDGPPGVYVEPCPAASVAQFAEAIAPLHPQVLIGIRPGEKRHEKLAEGLTSDTAPRLTTDQLAALLP